MNQNAVEHIRTNPKYQALKRKRNAIGWTLTLAMFVAYYGYIALVAFNKAFLGQKISAEGVTTIGVPIGMGLIVFTILITGYYVRKANGEFDEMTAEILKEAQK